MPKPKNVDLSLEPGDSDDIIEDKILDAYALEGDIARTAIRLNTDPEVVRKVLEDPKLGERILARRRGVLTLDFFTRVLPSMMQVASSGESGSTTAAKMILDMTGINQPKAGRRGRPRNDQGKDQEDKPKTLEQLINESVDDNPDQ